MNVGLQKTSLVNFPGRVAAAVFLPGCNLRCPFCHNPELATASVVSGPKQAADGDFVPLEAALEHLERRRSVLGGLAISGGEPLLSPALAPLIKKARELALAVKVDTNGTLPDMLAALLENPELCPDMVAVDVKTSPGRYGELSLEGKEGTFATEGIRRTLAYLALSRGWPRPVRVEYRTVLVPGLVAAADIAEIGALLPRDADWQLAAFQPGHCLDPAHDALEPYGPAETARLLAIAKEKVSGAQLR